MTYHLKYQLGITPGQYALSEEDPTRGINIVDSLFIGSIKFAENDSQFGVMVSFDSFDGRKDARPMSDADIWRMWVILAARLAASKTLKPEITGFLSEMVQGITGYPPPYMVPDNEVSAVNEMVEHIKQKGTVQ